MWFNVLGTDGHTHKQTLWVNFYDYVATVDISIWFNVLGTDGHTHKQTLRVNYCECVVLFWNLQYMYS